MKKKLLFSIVFSSFLFLFSLPFFVSAAAFPNPPGLFPDWEGHGFGSILTAIFNDIYDVFALIIISAGTIGVVVSGYMFIVSSGESGKVASARQILIYSLVGVFVGTISIPLRNWAVSGFKVVQDPVGGAVENIALWLAVLVIPASVIGVIVSAYMFIMSSGEPGKVATARQILIYSLVGAFVGAASLGLSEWASVSFSTDPLQTYEKRITEVFMTVANWLFSILIVMAVIGIVAGGYMFVTSAGDTQKSSTARSMVVYSLIGVLVAASSWALVAWVRDFF